VGKLMFEKIVFKYKQKGHTFYSAILTYKEIIKNSSVSVYNRENRMGYQRALNDRHLKKIVRSLKIEQLPISPTSILLGVDEENLIFEKDKIKINKDQRENNFRIIDGQHRIMAIKKYIEELSKTKNFETIQEIEEYQFSVIIMPINKNKKIKEVETFQAINSKAKPLKTDLTRLALIRYQELEKIKEVDFGEHLSHRIMFSLNDNKPFKTELEDCLNKGYYNVWKDAIKLDVNNDDEIGIIGYSAFSKSIMPICNHYLSNELIFDLDFESLDELLNAISDDVTFKLLIPIWNVVRERWPSCFLEHKALNSEIYFNEDFYIQKNMGIRPIHQILLNIVKGLGVEYKNYNVIIENFKIVLNNSKLTVDDWKKGGKFKGLSSEAGFNHIENVILNKV
jgi:DGQHR domain-containing protein